MNLVSADIFYLYARAVNKTLMRYGEDQLLNGTMIRRHSTRLRFIGMLLCDIHLYVTLQGLSGTITMDDMSERIQSYAVNRMDDTGRFEKVITVDVNISCEECSVFTYEYVSLIVFML